MLPRKIDPSSLSATMRAMTSPALLGIHAGGIARRHFLSLLFSSF